MNDPGPSPSQPGWGHPPGGPPDRGQGPQWGSPPPSPSPPSSQPTPPPPWSSPGAPYPAAPPVDPYDAADRYQAAGPYQPPGPSGRRRTNGAAIAGFVLGLLAALFFWLTFIDFVLVILGIIFSALGIAAAGKGAGRRALAIWGLVLSLVGGVAAVGLIVVAVSRSDDCKAKYGTTSGEKYNACLLNLD